MGAFDDVTLNWGGRDYTIPANRMMGAIARIEDVVTLVELNAYFGRDAVPLGKISMAFGAVLRYAGTHDAEQNAGAHSLPSLRLPAEVKMRWQPTGSSWLDQRAGQAEFIFSNTTSSKKIQVELVDEDGKTVHEEINTVPFHFLIKIIPGRTYTLRVSGTDGMTVEGSILGAITPKFGA